MAFYSVRIDDNGKEIETTRQTYRKFYNDACGDGGSIKANDQDNFQSRQTCRSPINTFKTVRYVNSATFIEKDHDPVKKQPLSDQEEEESDEINSDTFDFSGDGNGRQYQSHIATDKFNESVPVLELNSNESFPSSNNLTYSYRRVCEVTKIIQKPDAYKEWLDAKRTALMYQREMKMKREKQEEKAKEERKRLAEEKFNEWLARKAKDKATEKVKLKSQSLSQSHSQTHSQLQSEPKKDSNTDISFNTLRSSKSGSESNFVAWLEQKKQREKIRKEMLNQELKREEELKLRRKREAAHVYENWLKTAPQKPKPVPLNQGLFTLKGTISQIYVNPIPWVSTYPDDNSKSL